MLADLRNFLIANVAEVAALSGQKVHVSEAEQGTTGTHVVISHLGEDPNNHLGGRSGFKSAQIDIDCKASTPEAAEALADAIADVLEPHAGAMGTKTLKAAIQTDTREWVESAKPGQGAGQSVTTLEFTLQYS